MRTDNMRGHACCVAPLEGHEFVGSEFLCTFCHRPRALHHSPETATKPSNLPSDAFRIRSPSFSNFSLGPLTDKKIEQYMEQGWYSAEFREMRRQRWAKKSNRKGNFVEREGRLIYSPL